MAEAETELRQRLLCRVTCVFWIAEEVLGQPFDARRMADAEGLERTSVTGFRASHQTGVTETRVVETTLAQRLSDRPHSRTSLNVSVGSISRLGRAIAARPPRTPVPLRRGMRFDAAPARGDRYRGDDGRN